MANTENEITVECAACETSVSVEVLPGEREGNWSLAVLRPRSEGIHDEANPECPRAVERREASE